MSEAATVAAGISDVAPVSVPPSDAVVKNSRGKVIKDLDRSEKARRAARLLKQNYYKPCTTCGQDVHMNAVTCKACSATSPWPPKPRRGAGRPPKIKRKRAPVLGATAKQLGSAVSVTPAEDLSVLPHIAVKDFNHAIGAQMLEVKAGRLIDDIPVIRSMLAANQPIIPSRDSKNVVCCPHCTQLFVLPEIKQSRR